MFECEHGRVDIGQDFDVVLFTLNSYILVLQISV